MSALCGLDSGQPPQLMATPAQMNVNTWLSTCGLAVMWCSFRGGQPLWWGQLGPSPCPHQPGGAGLCSAYPWRASRGRNPSEHRCVASLRLERLPIMKRLWAPKRLLHSGLPWGQVTKHKATCCLSCDCRGSKLRLQVQAGQHVH